MSTRIEYTGPVKPPKQGVQAPPTLRDRVAHSSLIVVGSLHRRSDGGRRFEVSTILKGDERDIADIASLAVPRLRSEDRAIVLMAARDEAGVLRLTADPRSVESGPVTAILAAVADRPTSEMPCGERPTP
jgi:hypothetical protein